MNENRFLIGIDPVKDAAKKVGTQNALILFTLVKFNAIILKMFEFVIPTSVNKVR